MEFSAAIYVLVCSVAISMGYFVAISGLHRFKVRNIKVKDAIPVSVIIAAKDEEHNLRKLLPIILTQAYDQFEVIVVDDHSTDGTLSVLEALGASHDNLKYAGLAHSHGKKSAITQGIEMAKNDWLLFTDADCSPISVKWISSMMSAVLPDTSIVLGYSPFLRTGGLVNAMARVDAFSIGVQYLAFALLGRPYMGVGRNMAYRKSLFQSSGGFERHKDVLSGDDDLFVQGAASAVNTTIAFEPDAQTTSESKTTLIELFIQKRRHISTGFRYKKSILVMLGLVQVNNLLFYTALAASVFEGTFIWIGLVLALLRFYSQYVVLKKSAHRLGEVDLLLLSLSLELPLAVFSLLVVTSNIIYDTRRWS